LQISHSGKKSLIGAPYRHSLLDKGRRASCLELELSGDLPGVLLVGEVSVRSSLKVDGTSKVKILDNDTRTEIKVVTDNLDELSRGLVRGTVSVNKDGKGLGNTNGVGELNKGTLGKTSSNEGLGDPTGSVGSRSVDLGEILTGEGTTTVSTPTTVGVDNDLTASKTGITLGTTNDKSARGLDVVLGVVIKVLGRNDLLDDVLKNSSSEIISRDLISVLGRDDDSVNTERNTSTVLELVLNSDLSLGIGSQPTKGEITTSGSKGSVKLVGKNDSEGEELLSLVGGITEHDTLVTSTKILKSLLVVETLSDIGRLLLNGNKNVTGLVVKTLLRVVVTNVLDGVTDNLLEVELGSSGDLTEDHDHTGLGSGLASNLGEGVLLEAGIEDGVRDLITDLIGVTLTDGLGGEKEGFLGNGSSHYVV